MLEGLLRANLHQRQYADLVARVLSRLASSGGVSNGELSLLWNIAQKVSWRPCAASPCPTAYHYCSAANFRNGLCSDVAVLACHRGGSVCTRVSCAICRHQGVSSAEMKRDSCWSWWWSVLETYHPWCKLLPLQEQANVVHLLDSGPSIGRWVRALDARWSEQKVISRKACTSCMYKRKEPSAR